MKLQFDAATFEGGRLCLTVTNKRDARRFALEMKPKLYDCELKEHRNRRSLDANAYCWVLLGKLAEVTGIRTEDIYRQAIRDIGGNYDVVTLRDDAVDKFRAVWAAGHLGQVSDVLGANPMQGYTDVVAYYGSSTYDTKQMARLIDAIVQECKEQGIETMSERELSLLKGRWSDGHE